MLRIYSILSVHLLEFPFPDEFITSPAFAQNVSSDFLFNNKAPLMIAIIPVARPIVAMITPTAMLAAPVLRIVL